jgi:hypothetical protein
MSGDGLSGLYVPQVEVKSVKSRSRHVEGLFLCGPIPLSWLGRVCKRCDGRTLATALGIWWLAGLRDRQDNLQLTTKCVARFGVSPSA